MLKTGDGFRRNETFFMFRLDVNVIQAFYLLLCDVKCMLAYSFVD